MINVAVQYCLSRLSVYAIRKALYNRRAKIQLIAKTAAYVTHAKVSPAVLVIGQASHCHAIKAGWTKVQMLVAVS
jgi:hypothetical protein